MQQAFFSNLVLDADADLRAGDALPGDFEVRLNANEAPPFLSPEARAELARALVPAALHRYPDPSANLLRRAFAAHCEVDFDEVLAGAGSDEVIAILLTALARPRSGRPRPVIVTVSPTFGMYKMNARARGYDVVEVPLDDSWDLDVEAMCSAVEQARPNIVFLASPNNPTGALLSSERIEAVLAASPDTLVVIDEAYVDYAPRAQLGLRGRYPHVAFLRTLSKVGFAALRVDWVMAPPALVRELDRKRQPYNLPAPSQLGGTFVLTQLAPEIAKLRDLVVGERARLAARLGALGFDVAPSDANFLWVESRRPAEEVFHALAARGVLVSSFHARGGRLARRLRITIGLPSENDRLLAELAPLA